MNSNSQRIINTIKQKVKNPMTGGKFTNNDQIVDLAIESFFECRHGIYPSFFSILPNRWAVVKKNDHNECVPELWYVIWALGKLLGDHATYLGNQKVRQQDFCELLA